MHEDRHLTVLVPVYRVGDPKMRTFSHPHTFRSGMFDAAIGLVAQGEPGEEHAVRLVSPGYLDDEGSFVAYGAHVVEDSFSAVTRTPLIRCWRATQYFDLIHSVYGDVMDACWVFAKANDLRKGPTFRSLLERQIGTDDLKIIERQFAVSLPTMDELAEMVTLLSAKDTLTFIDLAEMRAELGAVGIEPKNELAYFLTVQQEMQEMMLDELDLAET